MRQTSTQSQFSVFISHDWEDTHLYEQAVQVLEYHFTGFWQDLSVPRANAIQIATSKRAAWNSRASAVADEQYALKSRLRNLNEDLERVGKLGKLAQSDAALGSIVHTQRKDLERLSKVLPNARARERYVSEPITALNAVEQALRVRSLLDKTVTDATRILSNEVTAVEASIDSIDKVLARIEHDQAQIEEEQPLLDLPASAFAFQKMPMRKTLAVDRLLAEQLSALVSQSDLVLLLINDYGMYKSWIHYEMTLAIRHRRPLIAIPARGRLEATPGLLKDLTSFGAVITDWEGLPGDLRKHIRTSIKNADV